MVDVYRPEVSCPDNAKEYNSGFGSTIDIKAADVLNRTARGFSLKEAGSFHGVGIHGNAIDLTGLPANQVFACQFVSLAATQSTPIIVWW